jgi:AcrR family transcriptional regulator
MPSSLRKNRILDKAGTLFWQKGYHDTSMRDIATACDCKPANIYNYFSSKEDILFEVIRDITGQSVRAISPLENDDTTSPVDQLRSLIKGHFNFLVQMRQTSVLISDTGLKDLTKDHRKEVIELRDRYDSILRKVIHRGIEAGYFSVADEKVVGYLISSVIVRSNIWFSKKGRLSAEHGSDLMFDFIYRGLKTESPSR